MPDKKLTCRDCNCEFIFTERDQAFYQEKGFSQPLSCPGCRAKRKAERLNQGGNPNRPNRFNN